MTSENQNVSKILLVAITRMGDMLQATPTIIGLKQQYPNAKLTVAIERNFAAICEGIPGIDTVYEIDLGAICQCLARERDGVVDAYKLFAKVLDDLRAEQFDYCLNMSSSGYTALLLKMLNIKDSRGWISDDEGFRLISNPWAMLFAAFVYHSNRDYNSINLVDIVRCSAGVTDHPNSLVYNVPERAKEYAGKFFEESGIARGAGPLIAIQAGASQEKRQWSPERFATLSRLLVEKLNARLVFTGSKSELPIIEKIFAVYNHPQITCAAGKTDIAQLGAILERCDVLITGDTGPMHLSVAVGRPVVALFLASALCFETGPYGEGNIVVQPQIVCNPCNPNLPCSRTDCHDQISPELIFELTKLRLEKTTAELSNMTLPATLADPQNAIIYTTIFDEDNFVEFRPMNGQSARKGFSAADHAAAREAYRRLWKHEFNSALPGNDPLRDLRSERFDEALPQIRDIIRLADEGKQLMEKLDRLVRDRKSPPRLLGELNAEQQRVDRMIEEIGLGHGVLGAVIRMFIMEKENMRGDDPLLLASEMKGLYDVLSRRVQIFGSLFTRYSKDDMSDLAVLSPRFAETLSKQQASLVDI